MNIDLITYNATTTGTSTLVTSGQYSTPFFLLVYIFMILLVLAITYFLYKF